MTVIRFECRFSIFGGNKPQVKSSTHELSSGVGEGSGRTLHTHRDDRDLYCQCHTPNGLHVALDILLRVIIEYGDNLEFAKKLRNADQEEKRKNNPASWGFRLLMWATE